MFVFFKAFPREFNYPFSLSSKYLLCLFSIVWCSSASAQTFSLPSSSTTGYFTITWSGVNTYAIIDEIRPDSSTYAVAGGSPSGTINITRPSGTYTYRLRQCIVGSGTAVCSQVGGTKSISINIPPVAVNAYFTPTVVNAGESATLYWSSTNAAYCKSTEVPQVSGTSGSFVYLVPANYSKDTFQVVVMCYQSGPGYPGGAGTALSVNVPSTTTYSYDELGRLRVITQAGTTDSYNYDNANNRTTKTVTK